MKTSEILLKNSGIIPKLRLGVKTPKGVKGNGVHKVKMLEDKVIKVIDRQTGKEIEMVEYIVEEGGSKKVYRAKLKNKEGGLSYLVERLAEVKEGEEVYLEMKKAGIKNYIQVTPVTSETVEIDTNEDYPDYEEINMDK